MNNSKYLRIKGRTYFSDYLIFKLIFNDLLRDLF